MSEKAKKLARKARSPIGSKAEVLSNKIVTKRKSASCKDHFNKNIATWVAACKKARQELGLTGFVALKKGTPFYDKAKELVPSVRPLLLRKGSTKTSFAGE